MTLAEQGAYRNLLDELWLRGGVLPNDDRQLANVCGDATQWRKVKARVLERFYLTPEGYRHVTHDEVSEKLSDRSERQAARGRKRAESAGRAGGRFTSRAPATEPASAPAEPPAPSIPSPSRTTSLRSVVPDADAPAPRKRARREPREPEKDPAPTRDLIDFWQTAEKVEGIQPHGDYGRHAKVFRPLWEALGKDTEKCRRAITLFLQCREPRIVGRGHDIGDFQYGLKRWIRAANGTVVMPTAAAGFKSKADRQREAFQQSLQLEPGDHVPQIGGPACQTNG